MDDDSRVLLKYTSETLFDFTNLHANHYRAVAVSGVDSLARTS